MDVNDVGENGKVLVEKVRNIVRAGGEIEDILGKICSLLRDECKLYDWVGFYIVGDGPERTLVLGPYVGDDTEHTSIRVGQGVCGQCAQMGHSILIPDVSQEKNYLSCSILVKSEIVVPVLADGELLAVLDIDSHTSLAFKKRDRVLLEEIAGLVGEIFPRGDQHSGKNYL